MITLRTPLQMNMRGGFATTTDAATIIEQRILDVLVTNFGERVMRPSYGADMQGFIFSPVRDDLMTLKAQEVREVLRSTIGMGEIISVTMSEAGPDSTGVRVAVEYVVEPGAAPRVAYNTISGLVTEETMFKDTA